MTSADLLTALDVIPVRLRERIDYDSVRLLGSRCEECGRTTWPPRALCADCGSSRMATLELPATGVVQSWTIVRTPLPGIAAPYVMGLLDVGGVRIFAHLRGLDGDPTSGLVVQMRADRDTIPHFWFEREDTA